jgi:hypothetical protein
MPPSLRILPGGRAPTVGNRYATDKDESNASINYAARKFQGRVHSALIVLICGAFLGLAYGIEWLRAAVWP